MLLGADTESACRGSVQVVHASFEKNGAPTSVVALFSESVAVTAAA